MIPLFYISALVLLHTSPVALSVLSFSAFGPFILTSFSLNFHFPKGRLFCVVVVFVVERLGVEYCSWWYVQRMLPYGTSINLYAFM